MLCIWRQNAQASTPAAWRRGMMRRDINTLWRMIRLLGQNAGLLSNALEVGKRLFVAAESGSKFRALTALRPAIAA
jgi:hypothetical protein